MAEIRTRPRAHLRALSAVLAIAALGAGVGASPAMAVPSNFWGVVPQATPTLEQLQRLKRGGTDSLRIPISWGTVQPLRNGPYDFSGTDPVIADAATAGIDVLPFLFWAPPWAVPYATVPGTGGGAKAPSFLPVRSGPQRSGWRKFVVQAIKRYGPRGTFWDENPGVPKRPIRVWQIWNEANFKYFVTHPNPVEYGKLVKLSYGAAKAADSGARIILGGLFARPIEAEIKRGPPQAYFAADFLDQMYERTPGVKSKFQGYALHPYTGSYKNLTPACRRSAAHPRGARRRWQGALGDRARLELAGAPPRQQLCQRPQRPDGAAEGRLLAVAQQTAGLARPAGLLVLHR